MYDPNSSSNSTPWDNTQPNYMNYVYGPQSTQTQQPQQSGGSTIGMMMQAPGVVMNPGNVGNDISFGSKVAGQVSGNNNLGVAGNLYGLATNPGNVGNDISTAAKLGSMTNDFGQGAGSTVGSILGTAGKVLPWVGIAAGLPGLFKNNGNVGNVMNAAGEGAAIGSVIPGLGTLAGLGIGAAVGGIKDLFNIGGPSQQELQGRSTQNSATGYLSSLATPAEQQEAQSAVKSGAWNNTQSPLSLIVTRDALQKQLAQQNGGQRTAATDAQAETMAEQYMNNLGKANTQGSAAVQQAYTPIAQLLQSQGIGKPQTATS